MKYNYSLIRNNSYLKEIDSFTYKSEVWNIEELVNVLNVSAYNRVETNKYAKSFHRCRQWLLQNYPELIL